MSVASFPSLASTTNVKKPGHEYTKTNVKFLTKVLDNESVKKLQSFAENNQQTQGKFTIGDEKVQNSRSLFLTMAAEGRSEAQRLHESHRKH